MAAGAEARDGEDLASSLNDGSALSLQPIATDAMELERVAVIAQVSDRSDRATTRKGMADGREYSRG